MEKTNKEPLHSSRKETSISSSKNPYLESRALWNDLYGCVQQRLENVYRLMAILAVALLVTVIAIAVMACQSRIKPYVAIIHGDELITLDNRAFSTVHQIEPKIALINIKRFIHLTRKVSSDATVNRENQLTAISLTIGNASHALKSFYQAKAKSTAHETNQIILNSILRLSDKTFSVRWSEKWPSHQEGTPEKIVHYIAQLQYVMQPPSNNAVILKHNPFGFYITDITWSIDHTL